MYEALTGLATRRLFEDRTNRALARAARERWTTAVFVIDIDGFSKINESLGHAAGDEALREVARRLEACLRPYDSVARPAGNVARLGGDEFLAMCENVADAHAARLIASRISAVFDQPLEVGPVSVGIGIALAPPEGAQVGALILDAEAALHAAKSQGSGRVELFTEEMQADDRARRQQAHDLGEALEAGQFLLHYQPKILLANERIAGVEALVRWHHPSRGLVPPDQFIPLAEETGIIVALGAWVLEEACRQAQEWRTRLSDRPPLVMAVNVSARQFDPGLVAMVTGVLDRTGMPASNLCLELTESIVMADVESTIDLLRGLKILGVTLSIDDFGTGYSSLAYLRRLPIDELKIDRSFVDGLGQEPEDTAIVAGVVAMAQALELSVVAEGVETKEQLERLRVLGCESVQGYYFSRPIPAAALEDLLVEEWAALARRQAGPDADPGGYHGEVVVVADDSPEVLQLAAVSLTAAGFEVHQAPNGRVALEVARTVRPACVVLDVRMPEMDGFEACRALRADVGLADCTIVMLTSEFDAPAKIEGYSAGADDYIVKPFTPRDLIGRVRAAVARHHEHRKGPDVPEPR
ncbi:MAG TPA: EAL domain-containing protein [Acidimicrobiales bacterium]|nr:EAL domain-containing protein [Acidimicrobiales bacterium]